jgi:6-pyruvoyltetrahydropterin/6-carboxytetrahydropterin synthase
MLKPATIRKKFRVEMSHQLSDAVSADCKDTIHGHSYIIEVFIRGTLDHTGMVCDFGALGFMKEWIMEEFDHALFMHREMDDAYLAMLQKHNRKIRIMSWNPTAENMAFYILRCLQNLSVGHDGINVIRVRVHETETGYAEAEG